MKHIYALLTGLVFGIGIALSGMMDPAKVLNLFDVAGTWDPSLAFVMGGALVVTFIGYRLVWRRDAPLFGGRFQVPNSSAIDASSWVARRYSASAGVSRAFAPARPFRRLAQVVGKSPCSLAQSPSALSCAVC